jgi:hypothetical protein
MIKTIEIFNTLMIAIAFSFLVAKVSAPLTRYETAAYPAQMLSYCKREGIEEPTIFNHPLYKGIKQWWSKGRLRTIVIFKRIYQ